jgi:hypothetical protein
VISYRVGLLETTSTNSVILASIDATRRLLALHGHELYTRLLEVLRAARAEIDELPGLSVLGHEVVGRPGAYGLDETKIVVDVLGLGMSGYEASDYLRAHHRLCVELHDRRRVMAVVTLADDAETLHRLVEAFRDLARQARPHNGGTRGRPPAPLPTELVTDCVMRPRDAYFGPAEHVPLDGAAASTGRRRRHRISAGVPTRAPDHAPPPPRRSARAPLLPRRCAAVPRAVRHAGDRSSRDIRGRPLELAPEPLRHPRSDAVERAPTRSLSCQLVHDCTGAAVREPTR